MKIFIQIASLQPVRQRNSSAAHVISARPGTSINVTHLYDEDLRRGSAWASRIESTGAAHPVEYHIEEHAHEHGPVSTTHGCGCGALAIG
ncbi:unnamed protein product, partial [Mycena citricolor]